MNAKHFLVSTVLAASITNLSASFAGEEINKSTGIDGFAGIHLKNVIDAGNIKIDNSGSSANTKKSDEIDIGSCDGIDPFKGGYGYINKAEYETLVDDIMNDSTAMVVHLGVQTFCPSCADALSVIELLNQNATEMMSNTCNLRVTSYLNNTADSSPTPYEFNMVKRALCADMRTVSSGNDSYFNDYYYNTCSFDDFNTLVNDYVSSGSTTAKKEDVEMMMTNSGNKTFALLRAMGYKKEKAEFIQAIIGSEPFSFMKDNFEKKYLFPHNYGIVARMAQEALLSKKTCGINSFFSGTSVASIVQNANGANSFKYLKCGAGQDGTSCTPDTSNLANYSFSFGCGTFIENLNSVVSGGRLNYAALKEKGFNTHILKRLMKVYPDTTKELIASYIFNESVEDAKAKIYESFKPESFPSNGFGSLVKLRASVDYVENGLKKAIDISMRTLDDMKIKSSYIDKLQKDMSEMDKSLYNTSVGKTLSSSLKNF